MGYVSVIAPCAGCEATVVCNPNTVPSIRLTPGGPREPLCLACAEELNRLKVEAGLEAMPIQPDAYDAVDENEVAW